MKTFETLEPLESLEYSIFKYLAGRIQITEKAISENCCQTVIRLRGSIECFGAIAQTGLASIIGNAFIG